MAEVQTNDHGGDGKKNKQKKQTLRVDFTPMVDMNMLLITFFMFCTTLLKPQTMKIAFPAKDKVEESQENKVRQSTAITILLGANDEVYYYEGLFDNSAYDNYDQFLKKTGWAEDELRAYLKTRNKGTYEKIEELRAKFKNNELTEEEFTNQSKEVQDHANKVEKIAPTIMIKPSDLSSYKNMVDALDEMLICNIAAYAIVDLEDGDRFLLWRKTGNSGYLTDKQKVDNKVVN